VAEKGRYILGVSAYYHDSAAALVVDGSIVAAAQEERFTRKKFDARFPQHAINYCLKTAGLKLTDLSDIVFYDKPLLKFDRLLETYIGFAPRGLQSFVTAMPVWLKDKLNLKSLLKRELRELGGCRTAMLPPLRFTQHHQAHAASPSPFGRAGVLCLDGVGEWATTSVWLGDGNQLIPQWEIDFPHSIGLLYSAFTYYGGFRVNSGEYKLMGLAPYGQPKYADLILDKLIDLKQDGTFRLNMDYFDYATGLTMTNSRFDSLFGGPPRKVETGLTQRDMDIAASVQRVTEEVILRLSDTVHREMGVEYLCLAGGVALNCVANGRILREGRFRDLWVQPAAGDSGGALGAALVVWHEYHNNPRPPHDGDRMRGSYLGPASSNDEIRQFLDSVGAVYEYLDEDDLLSSVAKLLSDQKVIGWFEGQMEFGPRALGARSILGDPRSPRMQSVMNLKIKFRESFRPFAPAVLAERAADYFEIDRPSPYMLLVAPVRPALRTQSDPEQESLFGVARLNIPRSTIPAVTHVDYSARVQTVHRETNQRFYDLLKHFEALTGCAALVNTSFNVRGEPIVCSPQDAFRCFMRTEMDYLVLENFLLSKTEQPDHSWTSLPEEEFELD
jgi:carbamoyltransferase